MRIGSSAVFSGAGSPGGVRRPRLNCAAVGSGAQSSFCHVSRAHVGQARSAMPSASARASPGAAGPTRAGSSVVSGCSATATVLSPLSQRPSAVRHRASSSRNVESRSRMMAAPYSTGGSDLPARPGLRRCKGQTVKGRGKKVARTAYHARGAARATTGTSYVRSKAQLPPPSSCSRMTITLLGLFVNS